MSVRIFIDRTELIGYTEMRLKRSKEKMTGELTLSIFMGYLPEEEVLKQASKGREILVYVGGYLAFTGIIDRRRDTADTAGAEGTPEAEGTTRNLNIGPDQYTVQLTCRGKTKFLVDSSHAHPTGTMLRPTTRDVFETLIAPWEVQLDWQAQTAALDKVRFRDGGRVCDELFRVSEASSLYIYETREGKLRVTDGPGTITGEDIILGRNILTFSTEQAEDLERSIVVAKGQKTDKTAWGSPAVVKGNIAAASIPDVTTLSRTVVQLFGGATTDQLNRRVQYEVNRRNAASRKIELTVFNILQASGEPWDIGVLHNVSIPPAGVKGTFEITDLEYTVNADRKLETRLTLSPPPVRYAGATDGTGGTGILAGAGNPDSNETLIEPPSEWRSYYPETLPGYQRDLELYQQGIQPPAFVQPPILSGAAPTISAPPQTIPGTGSNSN